MTNSATDIAAKTARRKLPPMVWGAVAAVVALLLGSLILAAACCYTTLPQTTCHALQLPLLGLVALIGAFATAGATHRKGLVQGLKFAALLIAVLLAITLACGTVSPAALIIKAAIILAAAAIGGILGVF